MSPSDANGAGAERMAGSVVGPVAVVGSGALAVWALQPGDGEFGWGLGFGAAMLGHGMRLALAAFFFVAAWAAGDAIFGSARRGGKREAWPAGVKIALGLSLLCLVLFVLAAAGFWSRTAFRAIFAAQCALIFWRGSGKWSPISNLPQQGAGLLAVVPGAILALYLIPSLMSALTPAHGWDDLAYHIALPATYLHEGGFRPAPENFFAQQPGASDLLCGWALALGDDSMPGLLHFGMGLVVCLGLVEMARRLGWRRGAWWVPLLFICHRAVAEEMGVAYNDVAMALFVVTAWWTVWRAVRRDRGSVDGMDGLDKVDGKTGVGLWVVAGILGGTVAASKYTGGLLVLGIGVWAFAVAATQGRRSAAWLKTAGGVALFGGLAAAHLALWLVKNWMFAGNPVWPMLVGSLGGAAWSPALTEQLQAWQHNAFGWGRGPLDWLLLAPRLFFLSDYTQRDFGGPLAALPFVAVMLAVVIRATRSRRSMLTLAAFVILFILWGLGPQQSRFLIPALPLLALAGAPAAEAISRARPRVLGGVVAVALGIALAFNIHSTALPAARAASSEREMLAGRQRRDEYLAARVRSFGCYRFLDGLPPEKRGRYVVFLCEFQTYHARFPHRSHVSEASWILEWALEAGDARGLAERFRADGVRLVLVNEGILDAVRPVLGDPASAPLDRDGPHKMFGPRRDLLDRYRAGLKIVIEFLNTQCEPVFRSNGSTVYRIVADGG